MAEQMTVRLVVDCDAAAFPVEGSYLLRPFSRHLRIDADFGPDSGNPAGAGDGRIGCACNSGVTFRNSTAAIRRWSSLLIIAPRE